MDYDEFESKFIDKFDLNEFKKSLGDEYSDEMLLYPLFYRQFVLRRIGDFTRLWDSSDLKELPVGSVLHTIDDNFLMNKPIVFVPDVNGWSMAKEPKRKFMLHITEPPVKSWCQDMETFVLPQPGVMTTILNYRKRYQSFIRTCRTLDDIPGPARTQVQSVISYDTLYRARIFGLMRSVRRFKYIFANILNQIAVMQPMNRLHFITIPVGTRQFDRGMFLRTFKVHDRSSLKFQEDNWYLFCAHLLGFVHGEKSPSIFENIPKNMWDKIHFVLYSKTKVLILRLDRLKEFNGENDTIMVRLIKQLNMLAESGIEISTRDYSDVPAVMDTEEDTTLPDAPEVDEPFQEKVNVTVTPVVTPPVPVHPKTETSKVEEPVLPKPADVPASPAPITKLSTGGTGTFGLLSGPGFLKGKTQETSKQDDAESKGSQSSGKEDSKTAGKETSNSKTSSQKDSDKETGNQEKSVKVVPVLKVNAAEFKSKLSKLEKELEADIVLQSNGIEINPKWVDVPSVADKAAKVQPHNAPEFTTPVTKKEQADFNKARVVDLDKKAQESIDAHPELTAAQKTRAEKLAKAYKEIKVGTESIEQLLEDTPDDSVAENKIDCLKDDVEDESMLKSSVATFEHDYVQKLFKKDFVSELVSFNRVGMFLKDLQIKDASDSLNRAELYIAKYEDVNHKEHTIRFTLPKVDERGFCYVNGTLKVLKKQRVPNPICKVSNTRVTLNSDYNKYLVERNTTVAHSFIYYIDRIIKASEGQAAATLGSHTYPNILLPYELTAVASKYSKIVLKPKTGSEWVLWFHSGMFDEIAGSAVPLTKELKEKAIELAKDAKGTICGLSKNYQVFIMKTDGSSVVKDLNDDHEVITTSLIDFLCDQLQISLTGLSEWTDFKLLNKTVPTIFALCYRYGLTHMLTYTKTAYQIYDKNQRFPRKASDVVIRFADKTLVIPRVPLVNSMLFAGLNNYDLRNVNIEDMDNKDIYYELIQSKKISVHNLKGIDNFFDYFVDPITADVLHQMREPTDPKDLLIRATQLLTTEDHKPAASSSNFRFRSYERLNSAVYKVLSRAHATYRHKALGASNKFSIAEYEIKQLVVQDQLMENVDLINPINDIKYQCEYSHSGFGGRQSIDTFMVDDRQYPEDGIGIISEATVDSSKTAYAASMTMDPTMVNMRGMTKSVDVGELKPTQLLSPTSVLVPGVTQDDGKRNNFEYNGTALWKHRVA